MISTFILGVLGGLGVPELLIIVGFFFVPICILIYQIIRTDTDTDFTSAQSTVYAGFWLRFFAAIIDWVLIFVIATFIWTLLDLPIPVDAKGPYLGEWYIFQSPMAWIFVWLYHSISECSSWQGSIGKRILKLKVTDKDGRKIGFGRATGRFLGKFFSAFSLFVGFIMIAFTKRKQGLHDKMTDCLVILSMSKLNDNERVNKYERATKTTQPNAIEVNGNQTSLDSISSIEAKERLLFNSLKNNLISDIEFSEKSKKLKEEKILIQAASNIEKMATQLLDLVKAGLLTKDEYNSKYEVLLTSEIKRLSSP
jgi:uncharacterized RDD family membrane protein YckC